MTELINWYSKNARDLPWRQTRDPYAIWVSEIMLQQTQVAVVIPYYERWMLRFPNVEALAIASEQDALTLWEGLGYYRRCRNLLIGAKEIFENGMPTTCAEWLKIPGVGQYTSGAIASICFSESVPAVDGNVARVFARLFGCKSNSAELVKKAQKWSKIQLAHHEPATWNQALMELGATICLPQNPKCFVCPLSQSCVAKKRDLQSILPLKSPKPEVVHLSQVVIVSIAGNQFGIRQIPVGEWWQGMWEFPKKNSFDGARFLGKLRHSVTHHRIEINAYITRTKKHKDLRWVTSEELTQIPMPAPQRKIANLALAHLSQ